MKPKKTSGRREGMTREPKTELKGLQLDSVAVSHNGSRPKDPSEPAVEKV